MVLKLKKAALHGTVKFPDGTPVNNAIVKLFRKRETGCDLIPVTFAFTDEYGEFLFGVYGGIDYVVKVFFYTPEKRNYDEETDYDFY